MTDTTEVERFEPYTDEGNREGYGQMEPCENGDWVRATDYDALAADIAESEGNGDLAHALHQLSQVKAKLAEVEEDRDDLQIALVSVRKQLERYIGAAEAALPAVYRLGLEGAAETVESLWAYRTCQEVADAIRELPTPTATELMARIHTGEKE